MPSWGSKSFTEQVMSQQSQSSSDQQLQATGNQRPTFQDPRKGSGGRRPKALKYMHVRAYGLLHSQLEDHTPSSRHVRNHARAHVELLGGHGQAATGHLLAGRVHPTPSGWRKIEEYRARVTAKSWPSRWPKVVVKGLT